MENNQRNSRKRLNSLILLVAFTAVMLIVSTYAWFSTQKNVTLDGLYGEVNVAEGLQISLDAKHWVNALDFSDFDQSVDGAWTDDTGKYLDTTATFQTPVTGITNVTPDEYLPVSTAGTTVTGTTYTGNRLVMFAGNNENTDDLTTVVEMEEVADSGYFAFDLFLQNTTNGSDPDELLLDTFSAVTPDNDDTGIENTVRVGFALYGNDSTAASTADGLLAQDDVLAATSTGKSVSKVAIWEPNSNAHIDTILTTINPLITFSSTDQGTYGMASATAFAATEAIPTYALTAASVGVNYQTIYKWDTPETGLVLQNTLQTDTDFADGTDSINITDVSGNNLSIGANQYHKIRVYVWIEGQDPDCINVASFGGGLTLDLGFSKEGNAE